MPTTVLLLIICNFQTLENCKDLENIVELVSNVRKPIFWKIMGNSLESHYPDIGRIKIGKSPKF